MYDILKAFLIACFVCYITNEHVIEYFDKFFSNIHILHLINLLNYENDEDWIDLDLNDKTEKIEDKKLSDKVEIKYEDKYLVEIRKMDKEYIFNEEEMEKITKKTGEIYGNLSMEYQNNRDKLFDKIKKLEERISRYEESSDIDYCDSEDDDDDEYPLSKTLESKTLEEKVHAMTCEKNILVNEFDRVNCFISEESGQEEIMETARKEAIDSIINERLDDLKNSHIIEKTPNGNVLMFWNNKRGTFEYYSDNTIPYRYLEPVGRKYVKTFNCRPIFVDMEEELKLSEEKFKKEKEEKERLELEEKNRLEEAKNNNTPIIPDKKNVFAKFKSYNKEAGSGRVNMVAPPKNSIPNKPVTETDSNEPVLLKDRANRYTYEGKFANFNFLKKIDRKIFNKKLGLSFADFKKMNK